MVTPVDLIQQIEDRIYNLRKESEKILRENPTSYNVAYLEGVEDLANSIEGAIYEYGEMISAQNDEAMN